LCPDLLDHLNQTFKMFYRGKNPEVFIKVKLFLKKKNNVDDERFPLTLNYRVYDEDITASSLNGTTRQVNITETPTSNCSSDWATAVCFATCNVDYGYYVSGINPSPFINPIAGVKYDAYINGNQVLSSPIYALHNITIAGNISSLNNRQYIIAGNRVEQIDGSISNEIEVSTGLNNIPGVSSCHRKFLEATNSEISGVCGQTSYGSKAKIASRIENTQIDSLSIFSNESFDVIPNPTSGRTTFMFKLSNKGIVNLYLLNLLGQKVTDILTMTSVEKGTEVIDYDLSAFSDGVYIAVIESNGYKQTKRVLISR
jgi:hypothetical protein